MKKVTINAWPLKSWLHWGWAAAWEQGLSKSPGDFLSSQWGPLRWGDTACPVVHPRPSPSPGRMTERGRGNWDINYDPFLCPLGEIGGGLP